MLQSKIDLLLYPVRVPVTSSRVVEPYLGGGVGIVRSELQVDIVKDEATQGIIAATGGLIPEKLSNTDTDFQTSIRAGLNIPFSSTELDLGWQFYRTYVEGKNNSSHVVGDILKCMF